MCKIDGIIKPRVDCRREKSVRVGTQRNNWYLLRFSTHFGNLEQREQANRNKSHTKLIKQYREKIEKELFCSCKETLDLLDNHLIPFATIDESKVIYLKMKGDFNRYLAPLVEQQNYDVVRDRSFASYEEAIRIGSVSTLPKTHPVLLGLAINFSAFYVELLDDRKKACKLSQQALDDAASALRSKRAGEYYSDTMLLITVLRENISIWVKEILDRENKVDDNCDYNDDDE